MTFKEWLEHVLHNKISMYILWNDNLLHILGSGIALKHAFKKYGKTNFKREILSYHENLKEFRHELPLQVYENLTNNSQKKVGLDTAVPDNSFPVLFNHFLNNFPDLNLQYVIFGHIGNSHLHANIFCQNDEEYKKAVEFYDKCIDLTLNLNGTVSAEHGIGKLKKKYLIKMYGADSVKSMKLIKEKIDPKYLFGVGTMFDWNLE